MVSFWTVLISRASSSWSNTCGQRASDIETEWESKGRAREREQYLTQVHNNALMHFLPEMGPENLNERDLECGDLAMHEDASQIQLYLKPYIHLVEQGRGRR